MIDLHNHILPGVDDGAIDLNESIEIALQFVSEGVETVAATPHLDPERNRGVGGASVREHVSALQTALNATGVGLMVVPGNELYLTPDAPNLLESGAVAALGDTHAVLIEVSLLPPQRPFYLEETIFRLQVAGYRPILAHPERYPFVQRDPADLDQLVERGLVLQLTAPALLGEYGPSVRKTAERLLRRGQYALAGSDRHHPGPNRSLADLHARIAETVDAETADLLLRVNPRRVLEGQQPIQPAGAVEESTGLIGRLFRRT